MSTNKTKATLATFVVAGAIASSFFLAPAGGSPSFRLEFHKARIDRKINREPVVEIGDSTKAGSDPSFTINLWRGDATFKVDLRSPERAFSTHTRTASMRNGKRSATLSNANTAHKMYALNGNAFEWEFILKRKPTRNTWRFPIVTKNLEFFFQDTLHDSEKVDSFRPDSVNFSYAVYHKSRMGNKTIINGVDTTYENYGTGKAFHIYRPKAWDAAGDTVWCRILIDTTNGFLRLRVPRAFLQRATYPVVVDPTIGYTTAGGTEFAYNLVYQVYAGWIHDSLTTGAATLTTAYAYGRVNGAAGLDSQNVKVAVYARNSTVALSTLVSGSETTINFTSGTSQWVSASASGTLSASQVYVVAGMGQDLLGGSKMRLNYDTGTWTYIQANVESTFAFPADMTGYTNQARRLSVYFDYTVSGGVAETFRRSRVIKTSYLVEPDTLSAFGFVYHGAGLWTNSIAAYNVSDTFSGYLDIEIVDLQDNLDANGDSKVNIGDITLLIALIFQGRRTSESFEIIDTTGV